MFAAHGGLLLPPAGGGGPSPLHYTDNANRANDSTGMGADWTVRTPNGNGINLVSNAWTGVIGSVYHVYENTVAVPTTDDCEVSFSFPIVGGIGFRIYLRSNNSRQAFAEYFGGVYYIKTAVGTWAASEATNTSRSSVAGSPSNTDVFAFRAQGNTYTLKKNGSTTGMPTPWVDSGGAHAGFGRGIALGVYVISAGYYADDCHVDDV